MAAGEYVSPGRWRGRYYVVINGRRYKRTAGYASTKKKAEKLARDQEAKLRAGTWVDPEAGKITFAEYFEEHWFPNRGKELNTRANYRSQYNAPKFGLKTSFGQMQLRHIKNSVVQGWVAQTIEAGLSAATIEAWFGVLQTVLAARKGASAMRDGLIVANPCQGVEIPKRHRKRVEIYTPAERDTLLHHLDPWWRPLPLLDSVRGLRWGELMGLKVRDLPQGGSYREQGQGGQPGRAGPAPGHRHGGDPSPGGRRTTCSRCPTPLHRWSTRR